MKGFTMRRLMFLVLVALALAIPATASAAVGDEMLSNPGAENGSLGWDETGGPTTSTPAPTFTVSSDAHSGAHSLRVDWSGRFGGQYDGDAKWAQGPFNVVGGHYYSYSDWYKSSGNTELAVWVNTTTNPDGSGQVVQPGHRHRSVFQMDAVQQRVHDARQRHQQCLSTCLTTTGSCRPTTPR